MRHWTSYAYPFGPRNVLFFAPPTDAGTPTPTADEPEPRLPEDLSGYDAKALATTEKDLIKAYKTNRRKVDPTAEDLEEAQSLYEDITRVRGESAARQTAAAERAEKLKDLDDQILGDAPDSASTEPVAPEVAPVSADAKPAKGTTAAPKTDAAPAPEDVVVPETLAASGGRPRVARINEIAQRPIQAPQSEERHQPVITAAGNVKGFDASQELTWAQAAVAMANKADALSTSRDVGAKHVVATVYLPEVGPERTLIASDYKGNQAKIEAIFGDDAIMQRLHEAGGKVSQLVASGGLPGPFPADYTFQATGVADRPIMGCLGRFTVGTERGGVNFLQPPTLASVASGAGVWTHGNDANPSAPSTKARVVITPPNAVSVTVDAITMSMQIGNFQRRFLPEEFEGYFTQLQSFHARLAEANILNSIAANATTVFASQELGLGRDVLTHLERLATGIRSRLRTDPQMPIQVVAPAWLRNAIRADLVKEPDIAPPGLTSPADAEIEAFFDKEYLAPCWSYDSETSIAGTTRTVADGATTSGLATVTSATAAFTSSDVGASFSGAGIPAGTNILSVTNATTAVLSANANATATGVSITVAVPSQLFPAQAAGPIQRWPAVAIVYMFIPGTELFLDGGTYDLGIEIADSTTIQTNNTVTFQESFEATAFRGIESYRVILPVWVSGQASAAVPLANGTAGQ